MMSRNTFGYHVIPVGLIPLWLGSVGGLSIVLGTYMYVLGLNPANYLIKIDDESI